MAAGTLLFLVVIMLKKLGNYSGGSNDWLFGLSMSYVYDKDLGLFSSL